ncbi:MAG TPA: flagellar motor protein MotB [Steroidobacteraceae bacterium]|nr:flagellar motor protein MotB [Gammaproteobacteria bacterium]HEV2285065.1 flagellar motor protein MotB [Steroidobacteraceae bacterium]
MSGRTDKRAIVIVKRYKRGAAGHHGGAWKVAYADFVTAMMAFFLVMWLVTAVSKDQRAAIFDYFKNPSLEQGKSVKAAPGMAGPGGASTSPINMHGGLDAPRMMQSPTPGIGAPVAPIVPPKTQQNPGAAPAQDTTQPEDDLSAARKAVQAAERKQLESLMDELKKAIDESQALEPFKDQLLLDITPEGLRIQIVDKQNRPMFDMGSTRLKPYTVAILGELAKYLNSVPNHLSLTGHTDATPYVDGSGRTNWDLSADRANAARRALEAAGLATDKTARVVGLASAVLFDKQDPRNPVNRRISIIVMTRQAEQDAVKTEAEPAMTTPAGASQ